MPVNYAIQIYAVITYKLKLLREEGVAQLQ
jgi:hypothetical protein